MIFERRHPDRPWVNRHAVTMLPTLLRRADSALEWGSGRSTLWFAARVKHLTSVEHDPHWYENVSRQIAERGVTNIEYIRQEFKDDDGAASPYVRVCDRFADSSLGFVLVDGWMREHCVLAVIPKIAPGGLLMLDNANWYFDWPTSAPASRYRLGHRGVMQEAAEILKDWRMLWTGDGVSDAALWVRPG